MKKLLSLSFAAVAFAALASDFSPTIGVHQFTSSSANFLLPVEFNSLSGANEISPRELVATNGLDVGTCLYIFKNNAYTAWQLLASGWTASATSDSELGPIPADPTVTLAVGSAIWISGVSGKNISIYGQVTNAYSVAITAGTKESPINYLLCNPTDTAASLAAKFSGTPAVGDTIRLIGDDTAATYTYGGTAGWYKILPGVKPTTSSLPTIAGHQGFWYMSKGGFGTVTW